MWYLKEYDPLLAGSIDGSDSQPHDAALERAALSLYREPSGSLTTDPLCTIFVGRLSFETNEATLKSHFKEYGDIASVTIIRNNVTGLSQGYGFVTFNLKSAAEKAYRYANKSTIDGQTVLVDFERSRLMKGWKPRRLGGGFGGKKESGQLRFGARDRPFRQPTTTSLNRARTSKSREQERSDYWREASERDRGTSNRSCSTHCTKRHSSESRSPSIEKHGHRQKRRYSRSPSIDKRHRSKRPYSTALTTSESDRDRRHRHSRFHSLSKDSYTNDKNYRNVNDSPDKHHASSSASHSYRSRQHTTKSPSFSDNRRRHRQ